MGLASFDVYHKTRDELQERTLGGAIISIVCCVLAVFLFASELSHYRSYETTDRCVLPLATLMQWSTPVLLARQARS